MMAGMIALDYPYVSDYLRDTLAEFQLEVIDTPQARHLLSDCGQSAPCRFITPDEAAARLRDDPATPVLTNSENALALLQQLDIPSSLRHAVRAFKDKVLFRDRLASRYPDFSYRAAAAAELPALDPESIRYPAVLKPATGFFSIGVRRIDSPQQWPEAAAAAVSAADSRFPQAVVDSSIYVIEEVIEGEEYAVDACFDRSGEPIIYGIYEHLFSSDADVSDRVYLTSADIMERRLDQFTGFLRIVGREMGVNLGGFPIHAEVRVSPKYGIIPIEINPLRFGGWCTTPDLSAYAYGFNQYRSFLTGERPRWKEITRTMGDALYSVIVLDNTTGVEPQRISGFDTGRFQSVLPGLLEFRPVDVSRYGIFGFAFARTGGGRRDELLYLLSSDLREFITVRET
jgi:hypothetical protein